MSEADDTTAPLDRGAADDPLAVPAAEIRIGVRTSELDSFGHVNHAVYLNYFEHARFEALKEAGFSWSVLDEKEWAIFVVRIEVDNDGRQVCLAQGTVLVMPPKT